MIEKADHLFHMHGTGYGGTWEGEIIRGQEGAFGGMFVILIM